MTPKTITAIIMGLLMMACLSAAAVAGRATILYGMTQPHQYAFQPDPVLVEKLHPKTVPTTNMIAGTDKTGTQTTLRWGSRWTYREQYQATPTTAGKTTWTMGGKLSTSAPFPTTVFNQNTGKGRELSRVQKP